MEIYQERPPQVEAVQFTDHESGVEIMARIGASASLVYRPDSAEITLNYRNEEYRPSNRYWFVFKTRSTQQAMMRMSDFKVFSDTEFHILYVIDPLKDTYRNILLKEKIDATTSDS